MLKDYFCSQYKKLYAIEDHIRGLTPSLIQSYRAEHSFPILNQMYLYLTNHYGSIPPKSTLGKAVAYTLKHWYGLTQYIKDGRLLIDNNHTERIIRQFVMAIGFAPTDIKFLKLSHTICFPPVRG